VLCRAGIIWPGRSNAALIRWGTWFFAVAMAIGSVPNLASQSRWENFTFGPLALVLAALCTVVARATTTEPARESAGGAGRAPVSQGREGVKGRSSSSPG
jgi:hypothetical protein